MTEKTKNKKIKVCYVICYKDPNYIRTQTLTAALNKIENIELVEVRNRRRGSLRYIEVPLKLLGVRIKYRPDVFIVGFRAHEIFWAFYPAMAGKRIIFDEFIDHHDWIANEHRKVIFKVFRPLLWLLDIYMRLVMSLSYRVLTDTKAHAVLACQNYGVRPEKLVAVPVGADEVTFKVMPVKHAKQFTIMFYGTMLPLHGMEYILNALKILKQKRQLSDAKLVLIGGRGNPKMQGMIKSFIRKNALERNVELIDWVDYRKLPKYMAAADLCLGGPFGTSGQAGRVITGKTYQFLAMGKPTIIGRSEATEVFKDRRNCLLSERGSAGSLAASIKWAMDHSAELAKIGEAGRQLYKKEFSIESISRLLESCIDD